MRVDEIQNELGECISKLDQIETKLSELQKDYGYSKFYKVKGVKNGRSVKAFQ